MLNENQIAFNKFWDDILDGITYLLTVKLHSRKWTDNIQEDISEEINHLLFKEICSNRFLDKDFRPVPRVWLENLQKAYPHEAEEFIAYIKNISISSGRNQSVKALAASGGAVLTGILIGKKLKIAGKILELAGVAGAGYTVADYLHVSEDQIKTEVKTYLERCRKELLKVLETCC